jgi:hypothetical protein
MEGGRVLPIFGLRQTDDPLFNRILRSERKKDFQIYSPYSSFATSQSSFPKQRKVGTGLFARVAAILFVLFCVAVTNNAVAQCKGPVFTSASEFAAGAWPGSVTAADFNSDGIADVAVTNLTASSVSILLGDGKTISIPIVDDAYAEGNESFTITLSNATGVPLGTSATATVTINDNETVNGANPIDQTPFFVRQQYVDFLGREPDPDGAAGWEAVINNCPAGDTTCDRIHLSSGFFRSAEFQGRGYFVYRFSPVGFGRKPDYVEFIPDLAKVSGFLSDAELEAAKVVFITEFMARPAFAATYNALNNTQYVDTLLAKAGVTSPNRDFWIAALVNGTRTRATVLRDIVESNEVYNKYYNEAFVVMQYFGYLRRDPDALYTNWITHLNATSDYRSMINGFMNSLEYRFRFGP